MNLTRNPTLSELQALFSSVEDSKWDHVLWVDISGGVHLDPRNAQVPRPYENPMKPAMKFRLEGYSRGTGWTGPEAAQDPKWMQRVFNALLKHWKNPGETYIDIY